MIDFVLQEANRPFVIAIAIMFGIAILEGVTSVLGVGISRLLESIIPDSVGDVDVDAAVDADVDIDADIDADADLHAGVHGGDGPSAALSRLLGWLSVGRVPVLVLAVLYLTIFGLAGILLQAFVSNMTGALMPALIASAIAVAVTLPIVRACAALLAKIIPKDETEAVSTSSFVGRVATVTLGRAKRHEPTQARLYDENGQPHYVMVEPDFDNEVLENGEQVLLVSRDGSRFRAIRNTSAAMVDGDAG